MRNFEIKNQNGRSMIEMLGVLAIIGVLSVGGIAGYSKAMMKYRINKTIEQITLIAGNVRSFFAPQKTYEGLCNTQTTNCVGSSVGFGRQIIKKAKLIPEEMMNGDETTNSFGYKLNLFADNGGFYIQTTLPTEACIEFVTQDLSNLNISYIQFFGNETIFLSSLEVEDAIALCDDVDNYLSRYGDSGNYISIGFEISKAYMKEMCAHVTCK